MNNTTQTQKDISYATVVSITQKYLGPAANRFVARQMRNHLGKEPAHLQRHELVGLIDWFSMAMSVLSNDEQLIQQYVADLENLVQP